MPDQKEQLWRRIQELNAIEDTMRVLLSVREKTGGWDNKDLIDQIERTHKEIITLTRRYMELI